MKTMKISRRVLLLCMVNRSCVRVAATRGLLAAVSGRSVNVKRGTGRATQGRRGSRACSGDSISDVLSRHNYICMYLTEVFINFICIAEHNYKISNK